MLNYDDIMESSVLNENSLSTDPNMTTGSAGDSRYMWGIEYNIVPLSRNLDQKGNDTKHIKKYTKIFRDDIYPGQEVSGYSVCDHERHTGKIFSFVYSHRHPDMLQAVVIIDSKTQTQVRLLPHSVEKVDMTKKLINMRNVIELDKIRQQARVDNIGSIDSERLIESAGETENETEEFLDMTPEELMYRDELIEMLSLDEKTIRYMDIKFSGEKFSSNYMIVSKVPYFVTRLLGAPDNNCNQDYVREFLQLYSDMTHQDKDFEKYDSIYTNNDYMIRQADDVDLEIRSWRDMYMLVTAVRRVFKQNRDSVNYTPAEATFSKNWNNDANNPEYMKKLGTFVTLMCQTQMPEKITLADGTKKKIFSLNF